MKSKKIVFSKILIMLLLTIAIPNLFYLNNNSSNIYQKNISNSNMDLHQICKPLSPGPFLTTRNALAINNYLADSINYYYSNLQHDGVPQWWKHNVKSDTFTWDWTWSDATTNNCIELNITDRYNQNYWIVIVWGGQDSSFYNSAISWVFWAKNPNPPKWIDFVWHLKTFNSRSWDGANWHSSFDAKYNGMYFNGDVIFAI